MLEAVLRRGQFFDRIGVTQQVLGHYHGPYPLTQGWAEGRSHSMSRVCLGRKPKPNEPLIHAGSHPGLRNFPLRLYGDLGNGVRR